MNEETTTTTAETTTATETPPQSEQEQKITPALFDEPDKTTETQSQDETQSQEQEQAPEQKAEALKMEDIKLPDGANYDAELSKSFIDILNDEKLSRKELGQKLFDLYNAQGLKLLDGLRAAEIARGKKFEADLSAEKAEWLKQCQSDNEYGGQNWEASQNVIERGCKQIATPEAVKLMQAYNLNTHPEIVRMFYRAGKLAGEDTSQTGGNNEKEQDAAQIIFGASLKEYLKKREANK